jgi:hypothetical protein
MTPASAAPGYMNRTGGGDRILPMLPLDMQRFQPDWFAAKAQSYPWPHVLESPSVHLYFFQCDVRSPVPIVSSFLFHAGR